MIVLVSGATAALKEIGNPVFGALFVPNGGNHPVTMPDIWAIDNGAFSGFDAAAFVASLDRFWKRPGCVFVTAPDVVADAAATLRLFPFWRAVIHGLGYRVALVAQDGLRVPDVPWTQIDALFIGGSTEWKLGSEARTIAGYAKALGKWVHMGRVNSRRRMRYAAQIGCDSIDGSGFSKWSSIRLPMAQRWLIEMDRQPGLSL